MAMEQPAEEPREFVDELKPGTKLLQGQYTIVKFINAGGFGITYLAKNSLDRDVVIKECFPGSFCRRSHGTVAPRSRAHEVEFAQIVKLFVQEAKSLSRLIHPNIVGVHQVFEDNHTAYMAIDYIEGRDLLDIIEHDRVLLKPSVTVMMLKKLLGAIAFIHDNGMLHRDISPDNILISRTGEPVLIDFGAARQQATRIGGKALSALRVVKDGYSPQEFYVSGTQQAPSSDLYALAATFYHVISGQAPPNSQARLVAIAENGEDPYVPLDGRFEGFPDGFLDAIDHAISVLPRDRIQTAHEWLDQIAARPELKVVPMQGRGAQQAAPAAASQAPEPPPAQPEAPKPRRSVGGMLALLLGTAAIVGAVGYALLGGGTESAPSAPEESTALVAPAPEPAAPRTVPAAPPQAAPVEEAPAPAPQPALEAAPAEAAPAEAAPPALEAAGPEAAPAAETAAPEAPAPVTAAAPEATPAPEVAAPPEVAPAAEASAPPEPAPEPEAAVAPVAEPPAPEAVAEAPQLAPAAPEPATTAEPLAEPDPATAPDAVASAPAPAAVAEVQPEAAPETPAAVTEDEMVAKAQTLADEAVAMQQVASAAWDLALPFQTAAGDSPDQADGAFPVINRVIAGADQPDENAWIAEGVTIFAINGTFVSDQASIERVLSNSAEFGVDYFIYVTARIKTTPTAPFEDVTLAARTRLSVDLANGVSFQTEGVGGRWQTKITAVATPEENGLEVGDIVLTELISGEELTSSRMLEFAVNRLARAKRPVAVFAVERNGQRVAARMTLAQEN
jgi:hypothetical protein